MTVESNLLLPGMPGFNAELENRTLDFNQSVTHRDQQTGFMARTAEGMTQVSYQEFIEIGLSGELEEQEWTQDEEWEMLDELEVLRLCGISPN